ncbi:MAG: methyltransferase domain-containing protein [bacterium]
MPVKPDTDWTDEEIVLSDMTPDTLFVFDRMTEETIKAVDPKPGELILDVACGRGIDARSLAQEGADLFGIEASAAMIEKAFELLGPDGGGIKLLRSLAENLPFPDDAFDKVVTKGAMDHFADIEKSMAEMARITRPSGKVIIAIANFESLTCRLGRFYGSARQKLTGKAPGDHPFWEPPHDHNFKFDLGVLENLMAKHCRLDSVTGLSMLWGLPRWGAVTRMMPGGVANLTLKSLDRCAKAMPRLADVLVATGTPRKQVLNATTRRRNAEQKCLK